MKNKYHFIIDQSGSMSDCHQVTVNSLNEQFASLRSLADELHDQEFNTSLHFFNSAIEKVIDDQTPNNLPTLSLEDYNPNYSTSLNDAIGTIATAERTLSSNEVKNGTKKVVFVILTDGYENSSVLFSFAQVSKLIEDMQKEGYVFMFLGALADAKDIAERMSIKKDHAYSFTKDNMSNTYKKMGMSLEDLAKKKAKWNHLED